jgi:hypothetical protein
MLVGLGWRITKTTVGREIKLQGEGASGKWNERRREVEIEQQDVTEDHARYVAVKHAHGGRSL